MKNTVSIFLLIILTGINFSLSAQSQSDINVKVDPRNGNYTLTSFSRNWTFEGSIGKRMDDVKSIKGKDAVGLYQSIVFKWKSSSDYEGSIRWYANSPVIIFSWSVPKGIAGEAPFAFPKWTTIPELPYHFSYHNHIFALPEFYLEETSTPWLLFNDSAEACVISPASDFMVSLMTNNDSTTITSGLNPEVKNLPANFTHSTIMVLGKGIRKTWDEWGDALRALYNRKRPANDCDALLKYFGYWTDNGADYYYNYDTLKGYAETLLGVKKHYEKLGIPMGYMQLDSWWYEKTRNNVYGVQGADKKKPELPGGLWNRSGGLWQYKADPFLFPNGLAAFQKKLGVPLVTHNRWVDSTSPYHKIYQFSGLSSIDTAFWDHIMKYLKNSGVKVYEQDWMNYMYRLNPEMISDIRIGNAFTDGMAHAAMRNGINLQYCMALPRYFMQGLKYNNLTTIRPSGDQFMPKRWKDFIFTSQLAYEMGIWSWSDVFKSGEIGNMIVAVLSAGAVGTGDRLGKEDEANIFMACRNDGVLVKPDVPLLPMDQIYVQMARGENRPVLAYTYTRHTNVETGYVFAFADSNVIDNQFNFQPGNMGLRGKVIIYNPRQGSVKLMHADEIFLDVLPEERFAYYIVAHVTGSGIAFLGDVGKITATGKKRIASIISSGKDLHVKVVFAKGESAVTLRGYAEHPVTSDKGKVNWDAATHLFTMVLPAPAKGNSVKVNFK